MGYLHYGNASQPMVVPDRLVAHLKVLLATKFRRGESFAMTLVDSGRASTLWMQPGIACRFESEGAGAERLDPHFLQELAQRAYSTAGLTIDLDALDAGQPPTLPRRAELGVAPMRDLAA